ncbi:hypothetical protein B0H13DRAFT_1884583 [Mycena leptocephala]|nr:hypothetical protein B0H13DRAFT_1884583 [Mycena leptocephala]
MFAAAHPSPDLELRLSVRTSVPGGSAVHLLLFLLSGTMAELYMCSMRPNAHFHFPDPLCFTEKWAEKQLETNYEHAKEDLHAPGGKYATAAELHDVPLSSLWHREHGRKNRRDGHEGQKKVSTMEEEIVKLLKELDSWGLHFDREFIMARAQDILDERGSNDTITLSLKR